MASLFIFNPKIMHIFVFLVFNIILFEWDRVFIIPVNFLPYYLLIGPKEALAVQKQAIVQPQTNVILHDI